MNTVRSSGNPNAMLQHLMNSNPNYVQAMKIVQENNGDAKKAFYVLADRVGIDPQQILDMLR